MTNAFKNNASYTEHTYGENWVIHKLRSPSSLSVLQSLPDSVSAALGNMKAGPLTKTVVELDEQV